ncbi:hypothetical protein GCM10009528_23070 [Kineococcus aurantiacus]
MGTLAPASVDLIITSPPYWGLRTYGQQHNAEIAREWLAEEPDAAHSPPYEWYRAHGGQLGMEPIPDWFVDHLVEIFQRGAAALKPGGSVWVNIGDTYFARWASIRYNGRQGLGDNPRERRKTPMGGYRQEKQLLMIPARFAIAMQSQRWILRNDLIWHKPNVAPRPERTGCAPPTSTSSTSLSGPRRAARATGTTWTPSRTVLSTSSPSTPAPAPMGTPRPSPRPS